MRHRPKPCRLGSGEAMTTIIYQGKDITKDVDVKQCLLTDRAGGGADTAKLTFADGEKIWAKWQPKRGDTVEVKTEYFGTGILYVDNPILANGVFTVDALSVPLSAKRPKTRIWRDVQLSQLLKDVASGCGLTVAAYGINDFTYAAISQFCETDIAFAERICLREGYAVKVTGNKLTVYDERQQEKTSPGVTVSLSDVFPDYSFEAGGALYSSLKVVGANSGELIEYTAADSDIAGNAGKRAEFVANVGEAERWSKGYLRAANKYKTFARLRTQYITKIAAGSTLGISGFGYFDGSYFADCVTYDTVNSQTHLTIRKPIANY